MLATCRDNFREGENRIRLVEGNSTVCLHYTFYNIQIPGPPKDGFILLGFGDFWSKPKNMTQQNNFGVIFCCFGVILCSFCVVSASYF